MIDNFKIAAVVVTYNRKELLRECLDALLAQTMPLDSIILIDNASTDGTPDYLEGLGYLSNPIIDYIRLPENTGGAGGFHYGVKIGYEKGFDWIWLMDDDVIVDSRALECLISSLNILPPEVGFLFSNIFGIDGQTMNLPQIDLRPGSNGYPQWNVYLEHGIVRIREATFGSLLIHRNIIKSVGLPIKDFFIWGDDTEYTNRISERYPGYLIGSSVAIHKRKNQKIISLEYEDDQNRINLYYYAYRNRFYIYKKHNGIMKSFIYFMKNIIILTKNLFKFKKYHYYKFKIIYLGLFSGIFFNPKIEYLK
ncbi:MAG: glycosyltransferase family 2 protein [Desulfobaccales bacterium]